MPAITLTTSGTAQALASQTSATRPTAQWCRMVTIENQGPGNVYIGLQKPGGVSSAVTSSSYDKKLGPTDSYPIGLSNECNNVDLAATWCVADANTTIITIAPETE